MSCTRVAPTRPVHTGAKYKKCKVVKNFAIEWRPSVIESDYLLNMAERQVQAKILKANSWENLTHPK